MNIFLVEVVSSILKLLFGLLMYSTICRDRKDENNFKRRLNMKKSVQETISQCSKSTQRVNYDTLQIIVELLSTARDKRRIRKCIDTLNSSDVYEPLFISMLSTQDLQLIARLSADELAVRNSLSKENNNTATTQDSEEVQNDSKSVSLSS